MRSFASCVAVVLATLAWLVTCGAFSACAANDPIPLPKPGFDAAVGDAAKDVTSAVTP
jgi:hypothetical protein